MNQERGTKYNVEGRYFNAQGWDVAIVASVEFRVACDLVERALGIKLHRGIGESVGTYLYAHEWIYPEGTGVTLNVRVELNRPEGCKITYKRKWTKEPIVDEACLGIRH